MNINKSGKFYYIKRNTIETDKQLIDRSWYIVNGLHLESNEKKTEKEMKNMEKISRMWMNQNVLECRYSPAMESKIKDIEDKIFV